MKLTEEEKVMIEAARNNLKAALIKRSENPADFETNLVFMKEFLVILKRLQLVINPHLKKAAELATQVSPSFFGFFSNLKIKSKMKDEAAAVKKVSAFLYSPEIKESMRNELAKEPRIISIDAHHSENHSIKDRWNAQGHCHEEKHEAKDIYKIVFSDHEDLIITITNNDEAPFKHAKKLFDEKMALLANADLIHYRRQKRLNPPVSEPTSARLKV